MTTVPSSRSQAPPPRTGQTCLVAVDGSTASVDALVWALRYAIDRGLCVEILTVWPAHRSVLIHEVPGHFSAARHSAHTAQETVISQALDRVVHGPITAARLENADTGAAIVRASSRCDLVVLGSNPSDTSHSLTDRVLDEAACDVVVVGSASVVIKTNGSRITQRARSG